MATSRQTGSAEVKIGVETEDEVEAHIKKEGFTG
jgi:hypothetical protein